MIFLFILGTVLHLDVWYAGIPLVLAYGFLGLTRVWERLGRGNPGYTVSIVLTGVLLIGAQSSFYTENKPSMADAIAQMRELRTAGEWVGMNSLTGQDICAEHPAVIGYYAERPVTSVAIWETRRMISVALTALKPHKISEDVAVPRGRLIELIGRVREIGARRGLLTACYGHAGDGNLHVNLLFGSPEERERGHAAVDDVLQAAIDLGGTITGEHGVGLAKRAFLAREQSREVIDLQRRLKRAFDPDDLLNPGKICPAL